MTAAPRLVVVDLAAPALHDALLRADEDYTVHGPIGGVEAVLTVLTDQGAPVTRDEDEGRFERTRDGDLVHPWAVERRRCYVTEWEKAP